MVTKAAKAPIPPRTSGRRVEAASGPIRRMASAPATMSTPDSRYVSGSMNSGLRFEQFQLSDVPGVEADLVLPGEASVTEVAGVVARGLEHAVEGEIAERIGAEVSLDLLHLVAGADELLARRRVDAVIARPLDRRRGDAHVHLARAGRPNHLDDLAAGRPAHDGIVHDDHALARQHLAVGVELHLDPEVADALLGLDEGTPHVVVADEAGVVGQARLFREAEGRPHSGVRHGDDEVCGHGMLARQLMPEGLAYGVHVAPPEDGVGPREVHVLEHALELGLE